MKVLVAVASKHGATTGIAEAIADELTAQGITGEAMSVEDVSDLTGYDAVVLGSAIYFGRWLRSAVDFADVFFDELSVRPVWMFSSGPVDKASEIPSSDVAPESPIKGALEPREHRVFAGSLDKSRLGPAERAVVRLIRGNYDDYRDWGEVRSWARTIAAALSDRTAHHS